MDRDLIARLLSGKNQVSRIEKERILEEVLSRPDVAGTESGAKQQSRRPWQAAAAAVASAGLLLLVFVPWSLDPDEDELQKKGGPLTPVFRAQCGSGPCIEGAKLAFSISNAGGHRYWAAFAKRADGAVIWYFPATAGAKSLDLLQNATTGVVNTGVVLGQEHPPGRYTIYGIFSKHPLSQEEIRALVEADSPKETVLVKREISIQ